MEVLNQLYDSATIKLVDFLQRFFQIQTTETGAIDELSAQKLNNLLMQFGGLNIDKPEGYPYKIEEKNQEDETLYKISGAVTDANMKGLSNISVQISEFDIDKITTIAFTTTDEKGNFSFYFDNTNDLRENDNKTNPDIIFRLFDQSQNEIAVSTIFINSFDTEQQVDKLSEAKLSPIILINVSKEVQVRIVTDCNIQTLTEFEKMVLLLQPFMGQVEFADLKEDEDNYQISFLSIESGVDKVIIEIFKNAFIVERNTQLPAWAIFGLDRLPFDYTDSKNVTIDHMILILTPLQPASSNEDLNVLAEKLLVYSIEKTASEKAASLKVSVGKVLNPILNDPDRLNKIIDEYARFESDDIEKFWDKISEDPNLNEIVPKLQFSLQLAQLTFNNVTLMDELNSQFHQIKDLVNVDPEEWLHLVEKNPNAIPAHIEGEDIKEKAKNYAIGIQKYLEVSFSNEYIVKSLTNTREIELPILRRVASLNPDLDIINDVQASLDFTGLSHDQQIKAANAVAKIRSEAFSYPAYGEMLSKNKVLTNPDIEEFPNPIRQGVINFLANNKEFDIKSTPFDFYIREKTDHAWTGIENKEVVSAQVRIMQRIHTVTANTTDMDILLSKGFHSAYEISRIPMDKFVEGMTGNFSTMTSTLYHQKASSITASTTLLYHHLYELGAGIKPAIGFTDRDADGVPDKMDPLKIIPEWEELFGSLDTCQCRECLSVYSPAAYFVDLLNMKNEFIKNNNVYAQLFKRRIDLRHIKLSCENTNTLIPYIDLVNEILETYVANGKLAKETTIDTSNFTVAELSANAQHPTASSIHNPLQVFEDAYELLKKSNYPVGLPFDLPLETARMFLKEMGSSRYEVTKTFQKDDMPETISSIEAEHLSISDKEFEMLTGAHFDGSASNFVDPESLYYGYTEADLMPLLSNGDRGIAVQIIQNKLLKLGITTKIDVDEIFGPLTETALKKIQTLNTLSPTGKTGPDVWAVLFPTNDLAGQHLAYVNEFLDRTNLNYEDLIALLKTQFLNADHSIILGLVIPDTVAQADIPAWESANSCSLNFTRLMYKDGSVLSNETLTQFAKFIRLQKKLSISIRELDIIINGLNVDSINSDLLSQLPNLILLAKSLPFSLESLMVVWSNINTWGEKSLYENLFLNKAALKNDDIFLLDDTQKQLLKTSESVADHIPAILAAFKLKEADLNLIFDIAKIDSTAEKLTIEVISSIYRYVLLAKAVKLTVKDLVILLQLSGVSPWGNVFSVFSFIELTEKCIQSGLKVSQLAYIYLHTTDGNSNYLPAKDIVLQIAQSLRLGLLKNIDEAVIKDDTVNEEFLKNHLGVIFNEQQAGEILAMLKENTLYEVDLPLPAITNFDSFILPLSSGNKDLISRFKYDGTKNKEKLIFQGAMNDLTKTTLQDLSAYSKYKNAINELWEQPRKKLEYLLSGFLKAIDINDLINNNVTDLDKFKVIYSKLSPFIKDSFDDILIKQQLTNALKTDSTFVDGLLTISRTLWSDKLRNTILSLSQTGLWGTYYDSVNKIQIEQVDGEVNKNWGMNSENIIKITGDNFKVVWTGKIEVPKTELFTFVVKKDTDSVVDLNINGQSLSWTQTAKEWTSESVPLKTGALHDITLTYTEAINDAMVALFWSSQTIPLSLVPTANLYPSKPLEDFYNVFILLQKISLITSALKLTPYEIIYFSNNKTDFSDFDLSLLPTAIPNSYLPDAFIQFVRLVDYKTLRDVLQITENGVTEIFNTANIAFQYGESVKLQTPTTDIDQQKKLLFEQLIKIIIQVTGWNVSEVQSLIGSVIAPLVKTYTLFGGYFDIQLGDFRNEVLMLKLWKCLDIAERIGVSVVKIGQWVSSPVDFSQVQDIKRTLRAKYEETDWADVSKSVNDKLRVKQRDALGAFILTLPALKASGVKDTNGLYSYFLIDVEMDACMLTSRIKQAISSVQLFFQRCLMNLEQNVLPTEINMEEWQRTKLYRLWEANRIVFLYPENWIEPELRDNKTPFFKELESELLQNEVTNDNVEKVFMNYLEKLDDVAKLDICGMYEDEDAGEVHVFGRTLNMPSIYYYRKLNQKTNIWTAWEKVQLDIQGKEEGDDTGVHLIPVVWNRRLYLFWPIFSAEKAEIQTEDENQFNIDGKKYWEIKFAWSEYRQQKWIPKKVSKQFLYSKTLFHPEEESSTATNIPRGSLVNITFKFFRYQPRIYEHFFKPVIKGEELVISVFRKYERKISGIIIYELYNTADNIKQVQGINHSDYLFKGNDTCGEFVFTGCHNKLRILSETTPCPTSLLNPYGTINFYQEFGSTNQTAERLLLRDVSISPIPLLKSSDGIFQLLKSNSVSNAPYYNFFYEDISRNYFVTPEKFLVFEKYIGEVFTQPNKTDFVIIEKSKALTAKTIPFSNPKPSVLQFEEAVVLNPNLLITNNAAVSLISNKLELANSYTETKPLLDYSSGGYKNFNKTKLTFHTHYHAYVCEFMKAINKGGIDELLTLQSQSFMDFMFQFPTIGNGFDIIYGPDTNNVTKPTPFTHVEFEQDAAYGDYNWELFFHIPMLIANRLSKNQRFEEANRWYQFVFNPTSNQPGKTDARFWNIIPLMNTPRETIQELMNKLHSSNSSERNELENAIKAWRNHPFNPHLIARMRLIAYKKNTVMKYLDNLIAWGDQLFSRDTIESINEATQLYIMAAEILGRYPRKIPFRGEPKPKSFEELEPTLDAFSNALVKMETMFPFFNIGPVNVVGGLPATTTNSVSTLYFCLPDNDKLLGYWDLVADRLFKIRHCQNIVGLERQLELFEPRINPALLVQAVANGIDINSVLNDINAPLPHYRFSYILERALQMCGYLTSMGSSYLSALEKQDAEELSMLKANQESAMLRMIKEIKEIQIEEAYRNRQGLEKTKEVTLTKMDYYTRLINTGLNPNEVLHLNALKSAQKTQDYASFIENAAGIAHMVPNFESPEFVKFSFGGSNVGSAINAYARFINYVGSIFTYEANNASITGSNERRANEWEFQNAISSKELQQIDKQILASQIREDISTKELNNQEQLIENAQLTEEFFKNKFTNQELYGWMIGEMATAYFPYYQLVYGLAKTAESLYRFELGISNSKFITFGYWDSFRKGLMAGEKLQLALKQMEKSYLDFNKREYEITKNISLLETNPLALITLKETGDCILELPEYFFDMDYPGQYMRRIKSVTISIPCVAGPYTSINCTLTLLKSKLRIKNILKGGKYEEQEEDDRFETRLSATNSIATSHAQNDSGMFELNFRDERLLPFEGAGVISRWQIKLPKETNQFDTDTISDLIVQFKYTAREGGKNQVDMAMAEVRNNIKNGNRLFSLKYEFPDEWHRFLNVPAVNGDQVMLLDLKSDHFSYLISKNDFDIMNVTLFVDSGQASISALFLTSPSDTTNQYKFSKLPVKYGSLLMGHPLTDWGNEDKGLWKLINPFTNPNKLDSDNCSDIIAIVSYQIV
ncbi:MAG: neuraminidase-like domain-containing protein [Candidatus Saccharimonadaceae bacterium]